jgi:hypothetical protein
MEKSISPLNKSPLLSVSTTSGSSDTWDYKNYLIIGLVIIILFSFLGINLLSSFGNMLEMLSNAFSPIIGQFLSAIGYTTGTIINKTTDVVADTAKTGIDIAEGTIHSVGDLLKNASDNDINHPMKLDLDNKINHSEDSQKKFQNKTSVMAEPTSGYNPIQQPISSSKSNWCLIGEYQERRGCIEINEHDKCISGQIFPSQQMCINPTLTQNK